MSRAERVLIADEFPRRYIVVELVRYGDGWRYGYHVSFGGCGVGAGGRIRPAHERDPAYPSRDAALRAARAAVRRELEDALRPTWREMSPDARRAIEELLRLVPDREQLSLFEEVA
ncbi:hypothetical protein [Deferrisoma camini]|uniref:hypothetical protein n=1 Tax=Deferrisoma camini TaxID=1035120 RepID=UPI00046CD3ED|nr:hypothetical protein [Deferrisoma camini]